MLDRQRGREVGERDARCIHLRAAGEVVLLVGGLGGWRVDGVKAEADAVEENVVLED